MIIDEQFRQCVVFLYEDRESEEVAGSIIKKPVGTGFIVGVPLQGHAEASAYYVITAAHVVMGSYESGILFIRLNLRGGGSKYMATDPRNDWSIHPGSKTDVAILYRGSLDDADFRLLSDTLFVSDEFVEKRMVSPGDDLFGIGLFEPYPGRDRIEPICRFGNISLLPANDEITPAIC